MTATDEEDAFGWCCCVLLLAFIVPVVIGLLIFALKLGFALGSWLANLTP